MTNTEDFLLELGTEELPPLGLKRLSEDLASGLTDRLTQAKLTYATISIFATPRRLAVLITELLSEQPKQTIEKKGPRIEAAFSDDGTLTPAAQGFAKSCGLKPSQLASKEFQQDGRLVYHYEQAGELTQFILPDIIKETIHKLPIRKPMRWNNLTTGFVRPVHWIISLLGSHVIDFEMWGIKASNETYGHRFLANHAIVIKHPREYQQALRQNGFVIADFNERKNKIAHLLEAMSQAELAVHIDDDLLEEVTGLVEWPVALPASFDERFLVVPKEALVMAMQVHQKAFPIYDKGGNLSHRFVVISNMDTEDNQVIIAGNERVMRARLADAEFFFNSDLKIPLVDRVDTLKHIIFQNKLGSIFDKTQRIAAIATFLAEQLGQATDDIQLAAELAKADLVTDMVGEFPKLQGMMGYYYALTSNQTHNVAEAIKEHYQPRFAKDELPQSSLGQLIAIADRVDSIVAIFAIGQAPTGEKDPFGLRRAALGVIRILVQFKLNIDLKALIAEAAKRLTQQIDLTVDEAHILTFMLERQRRWNAEDGIDNNVLNAVMVNAPTHPFDFQQRVEAVSQFKTLTQAESLIAANKRVSNILKKLNGAVPTQMHAALLQESAEITLAQKITDKQAELKKLYQNKDYQGVLTSLSELQQPIDQFFEDVLVMVDDEALRNNRLALLVQLRNLFIDVADVSLL